MSLNEIISQELAPYKKKPKIRVLNEPKVRVIEEPSLEYTFNDSSDFSIEGIQLKYEFGGSERRDDPTRFELNVMKKRLDKHRRWIQLGILVGTLSFGAKAYDYFVEEPIDSVVTSEYVYGGSEEPHPAFEDLPPSVQKQLAQYQQLVPRHVKKIGYVTDGFCINDEKMQGCYDIDSPDPDRKAIYKFLIQNVNNQ